MTYVNDETKNKKLLRYLYIPKGMKGAKIMSRIEERELFNQVQIKFGIRNQLIKAVEEMAELQKELCKTLNFMMDDRAIAEEIADVEIMIAQLKMFLGMELLVGEYQKKKLERLKGLVHE